MYDRSLADLHCLPTCSSTTPPQHLGQCDTPTTAYVLSGGNNKIPLCTIIPSLSMLSLHSAALKAANPEGPTTRSTTREDEMHLA
jgi:hypothetical protein